MRSPLVPRRWVASLAFTGLAACRGAPAGAGADLVVFGRVWTGDSAVPWAEAVAVAGDTVIEVGDSLRVSTLVRSRTRILAGGAGMVVPGFMDGHVHFLRGGFRLSGVDLGGAATPAELIARVRASAAGVAPGEWIRGGGWDQERWQGTPLPDRTWIDSVTPLNPVFLSRVDNHAVLVNGLALALAGITRATREVPGGDIVRNREGEPTGILKDAARELVARVIPAFSPRQSDSALARAMAWAATRGVTAIADVSVPWDELEALERAHARHALTLRVAVYVPLRDWHRMADAVRMKGPGDDQLRLAGVKGYVDGSLGSHTALFYRPYRDAPTAGLLVTPEDSLRAWIGAADSAGLQVAVHAIGERANGLLLDVFDSVARAHGARDRRFRIEHAQHLRPTDVGRLARAGVIASMQPYHAIDDGRWAEKRIGPDRIAHMYVFRSLLDSGARLGFGSDWTVAPLDPLLGIDAAVTRRTLDGRHPEGWVPEQKITVEEALRAYTSGNAYAAFAEQTRGRLAAGYKADLVLLSQDLTRIPPEAIAKVAVRATVVGGRVVYESP